MTQDPRTTERLLADLLRTGDDRLAEFVRDHLAGAPVDPARLADARAMLVRIGEALMDPTRERMTRLEHARRVLEGWTVTKDAAAEATPPHEQGSGIMRTPAPPESSQRASALPPVVALSVEQYAYFCVERSQWPADREHTCAKYGLDPALEEALHRHYRRALMQSAELKARFDELQNQARTELGAS